MKFSPIRAMRCLWVVLSCACLALPAQAATVTYLMNMTGDQEVPGPGDPDGLATGTISLDNVSGEISWNFNYSNITAPSAMHIHTGAAGVAGGVFVGLGVATSGGSGTLINSLVTSTANINTILGNPAGYYVNIHNADFPGGAVRGQLGTVVPLPPAAFLFGSALALLGWARRRTR